VTNSEAAAEDNSVINVATSASDGAVAKGHPLRFSGLRMIHFPTHWRRADWAAENLVIDALLLHLMNPNPQSLSCRLRGGVLNYVEISRKSQAMASEYSHAGISGESGHARHMVELKAPCLHLRKLHLGNMITPSPVPSDDFEPRLLSWFLRLQNSTPLVTSVKL
jgi:hypothetical protein